jgi:Tfp pilus assembly protein PilV
VKLLKNCHARPVASGASDSVMFVARSSLHSEVAFTLLEVMIASAIFFIALFAILGVMSQSLNAARSLQQSGPTAGMVASEYSLTNKLEEGSETGDFGDFYPDYQWAREVTFYASNGLFQVDYAVSHNGNLDSSLTFLLFRPDSPKRAGGGKMFQ